MTDTRYITSLGYVSADGVQLLVHQSVITPPNSKGPYFDTTAPRRCHKQRRGSVLSP